MYKSLCFQTIRCFEWLIIDDGSSDNTEQIVQRFIAEEKLHIRYLKQRNGGKHRAINKAAMLARGEWFFIVDSDDYLPNDSLEQVSVYISQIADNEDFVGVAALRCYPNGNIVGGTVHFDVLDTDCVNIRTHYHVKGDIAEVWRTSVLKQYPFPEFDGEKFMSEGIVWSAIAYKHKLRYFNHKIYICDYLQDGLTQNVRSCHRKSPQGSMLLYATLARDKRYSIKWRIAFAINYWRYTIGFNGKRCVQIPTWGFLFYPLGLLFYKKDLKNERYKQGKQNAGKM